MIPRRETRRKKQRAGYPAKLWRHAGRPKKKKKHSRWQQTTNFFLAEGDSSASNGVDAALLLYIRCFRLFPIRSLIVVVRLASPSGFLSYISAFTPSNTTRRFHPITQQATMDSMRSLNTSLPRSSPRPRPPEQLLQSFKSAALSVTNLYKNAVHEQTHARHMGYQEAVEDLLNFLDKENLGLGDGEGWQVRQWATERSDGMGTFASDEEDGEKRSVSPVRKDQTEASPPRREEQTSQPSSTSPTAAPPPPSNETNSIPRPTIFTFSAGPQFPQPQEQDVDMQASENHHHHHPSREHSPVNISVLPRNPRHGGHRHNNSNHVRSNQRSSRESSVGLSSKRKFNFPDFFDLSGMGNRDIFGGGKRGRFI